MAGVWKRDGTIAVTKGSKKVVGTGTTFADPKNAAAKGHLLVMVTGTAVDLYEVDYSESNSVFYLVEAYRGDTGTGKAYAIDTSRTDSIPEFARRLNATLGAYQQQSDAFQALLTSDAATIEVTAPDGTKHTMIPWKRVTSEGEGQAARAKAEADKALAAADLAVNVVRDSAMPLPDVWIPLTDSLRMFTGLGREVKVGGDLVGRYVNFERASTAWYFDKSGVLRQVAINEPRFESEGLLVEGPATNILRWDQVRAGTGSGVITDVTSSIYPGINAKKVTGGTSAIAIGASKENIKDSTLYTGTVIIDLANSKIPNNLIRLTFAYSGNWTNRFVNVNTTTLQLSTLDAATTGTVRRIGDLLVVTATTMSLPTSSSSGGGSLDLYYVDAAGSAGAPTPDGSVCVVGFQLEEGATPSSFILTSNAAVTRAADICEIPTAGNIPHGKFTAAAQVNVPWLGKNAPNTAPRILSITGGEAGASVETTIYSDGRFNAFGGGSGASSIVSGFINRCVVSMVRSDTGLNAYAADNKNVGTQGIKYGIGPSLAIGGQKGSTGRHFFGHIRNIKIWHQEASDAQIKALR
ncbi:phage head spike fiber domain-containing protein [Aeromonas salmonicida]|uniref:phage head spike fiber domain-containing protein n=1 Tax=Aeromonas salmonicida TaxID=645 RepID=UPI00232D6D05|nr:hypothetical protein [Aeromonas salmonicida]WCH25910.1 hypothetical protein ONZ66_15150 [Aeromonas salmonicida]